MENENKTIVEESIDNNNQYIDAIAELKANSVSKDKYAQLEAENKKLLGSILNGEQLDLIEKEKPKADVAQLRKDLYNSDAQLSNLEYVSKTLELRNALIEEGYPDPFVPTGSKIAPTQDDYDAADRVADVFQQCIDYADGDSQLFTQELQRRTRNDSPIVNRVNKLKR